MKTVLHLHIPRTGGTSVSRALRSALRDRRVVLSASRQDLREALQDGADVGLVSGHFYWGMHQELLADYVYFIVLRDPVERVKSLYDYIRGLPTHSSHQLFAKTRLEDLLEQPEHRLSLSNGQVRPVGGLHPARGSMGEAILERAWENLNREETVVGFTDRIAEGLAQLGHRLHRSIPPLAKTMNRSTDRTPADAALDARILALNELDMELFRRARERFAPGSAGGGVDRRASPADWMHRIRRLIGAR